MGKCLGNIKVSLLETSWATLLELVVEKVLYIKFEFLLPTSFCSIERVIANPETTTLGLPFIVELFIVIGVASKSTSMIIQTIFC